MSGMPHNVSPDWYIVNGQCARWRRIPGATGRPAGAAPAGGASAPKGPRRRGFSRARQRPLGSGDRVRGGPLPPAGVHEQRGDGGYVAIIHVGDDGSREGSEGADGQLPSPPSSGLQGLQGLHGLQGLASPSS